MNRSTSPRRAVAAAIAAALAATLAFGGLAAAKDHPTTGKGKAQRTEQVEPGGKTKPAGAVKTGLKTKGNASHPGGVFRVLAVLKAPNDLRPDTIDAVVHFATGDVAVELTRSGGGSAYHAFVPVPDDEPEGVVEIDATAVVDGQNLEATGAGKVLDRGTGDEAEPESADEPAPVASSEPAESCEPGDEPSEEPTDEPSAEPSEEPSDDPSEEPSDEPGEPGESPSDEPSSSPSDEPGSSPNADEAAEACPTKSEIELTDDVITAVLDYLRSIFA